MASSAFLLAALCGEEEPQRLDGRGPFDARRLAIRLSSREDGAAEVQLGRTHIMCSVSCVLVQPYPDRHNEGILVIYTDFSPMADPAFEPGQPAECAVELGRIIDRGLRESRAIDMESLCVLAGKAVWSLRVDVCILNNGGNLIDAANVAALAALLSFRRPECSVGGPGGQDVIVHPPEIREPVPLTIHFLPIAVTFALLGAGEIAVLDPTYQEEILMKGRLTTTLNAQGDICSIQKSGIGIHSTHIMRYLRIASTKVANVTVALRKAVEAHELERAQKKIKRHQDAHVEEELEIEANTLTEKDRDVDSLINDSSGSSEEESKDTDHRIHRFLKLGKALNQNNTAPDAMRKGTNGRRSDTIPMVKSTNESLWGFNGSVLEVMSTIVSQRIRKLDIQVTKEEEELMNKGNPSTVKSKPASLLNAIKNNNLKKNKIYGQKT